MKREDTEPSRTPARPALAPALRRPAKALALLGLLMLVVPALIFAGDTTAGPLDTRVKRFVLDNAPAGSWDIIRGLDWLGEPVGRALLLIAVTLACLAAGRRALAITAALSIVTVTVLATALKPVVGRRIHEGFLCYPSGHSAALTAAAMIVGLLLADLIHLGPITGTAVVLAVTVLVGSVTAWAQINLDAHYPTDTVGGVGCALFVVPAIAALIDLSARRRAVRTAL
jgi:membrane-associated phospholipid phosphatase